MRIRIDDVSKNTFTFPVPIDNQDGTLKIGIKNIGYWVGFYNIYGDQICRYARNGQDSVDFKIEPGLYSFNEISRDLRKDVKGLSLALNKTTGLIELSIPDDVELWLPEAVKYMIGLDDDGWLRGNYVGDRPVEFLPVRGISIYLDEALTTNNLSTNKSDNIVNSTLLGNIPMLSENFGQYFSLHYDNPTFIDLAAGEINQLEFSLKLRWQNRAEHNLDNHGMPITLELEIK